MLSSGGALGGERNGGSYACVIGGGGIKGSEHALYIHISGR